LFELSERNPLDEHPDARDVKLSRRRGFVDRHPELKTSKGTIRLRPQDAAAIADDELLGLVGAALEP